MGGGPHAEFFVVELGDFEFLQISDSTKLTRFYTRFHFVLPSRIPLQNKLLDETIDLRSPIPKIGIGDLGDEIGAPIWVDRVRVNQSARNGR